MLSCTTMAPGRPTENRLCASRQHPPMKEACFSLVIIQFFLFVTDVTILAIFDKVFFYAERMLNCKISSGLSIFLVILSNCMTNIYMIMQ